MKTSTTVPAKNSRTRAGTILAAIAIFVTTFFVANPALADDNFRGTNNDGVSTFVAFYFDSATALHFTAIVWDTACDSHSAKVQLQWYLEGSGWGTGPWQDREAVNGQGCNTSQEWDNVPYNNSHKIQAVRIRGCKDNFWEDVCYDWTTWYFNPKDV